MNQLSPKQSIDPEKRKLFEKTVRQFQGLVYSVAYGILLDAEEALDITQEVFMKAHGETGFLGADFYQKAWLVRVARNLSLNAKRGFIRKLQYFLGMKSVFFAADTFNIDEFVLRHEAISELQQALTGFSLEDREILTLRFGADLSYKEIALEMNIAIGTVMSRLSRIKEKLGIAIQEEEMS